MKTIAISIQEEQKLLPRPAARRPSKLISRRADRANLRIVKDEDAAEQQKKSSAAKETEKAAENPFASWVMPPQQKGYIKGDDRNLLL